VPRHAVAGECGGPRSRAAQALATGPGRTAPARRPDPRSPHHATVGRSCPPTRLERRRPVRPLAPHRRGRADRTGPASRHADRGRAARAAGGGMTGALSATRARLLISLTVEAGDPRLVEWLDRCDPTELWRAIERGRPDVPRPWVERSAETRRPVDETLARAERAGRSAEHTSELPSREKLVCRP